MATSANDADRSNPWSCIARHVLERTIRSLKYVGELCLDLLGVLLDVIVIGGIERELVEPRQAGRRRHVEARGMMPFLGEFVLDLWRQVELREQPGGIGMRRCLDDCRERGHLDR